MHLPKRLRDILDLPHAARRALGSGPTCILPAQYTAYMPTRTAMVGGIHQAVKNGNAAKRESLMAACQIVDN